MSDKEKIIEMCEIELDIDEKMYDKLAEIGLEMIKDDKNALINYAVNVILKEMVDKNDN